MSEYSADHRRVSNTDDGSLTQITEYPLLAAVSIARSIDVSSVSIYRQLAPTGGIRPPARKRSRLALSLAEREEISRGIVADLSIRMIALQLGRAPSIVSREINRNGGYDDYSATQAEQNAWDQALLPKRCKLVCNRALARTRSCHFA
jgi:hypothetical protein